MTGLLADDTVPTTPRRGGREVERIFEIMVDQVLSGEWRPGMKLNEPELAQRFGSSRGPLREAIRRLQERELVFCIPNAGAWVFAHSPQEILDAYQIREVLEGMAARLAAQNMSDQDLKDLRKIYEDESRKEKIGNSGGFHYHIIRGSNNTRLMRLLDVDYFRLLKLWRTHCSWLRYGGGESWEDHERIMQALEYRDGECAEILMRRHIARLRTDSMKNLAELGISISGKIAAYS